MERIANVVKQAFIVLAEHGSKRDKGRRPAADEESFR
jgi:hypothetical protein